MRLLLILLAACLLAGCFQISPPSRQLPDHQRTEISYDYSGIPYKVVAWVDKPDPTRNERVTVHGSLLKYGVHLGGMMMQATWPDAELEPGRSNCEVQVIYGAGVCLIQASKFPVGEFVPVTVHFHFDGHEFIGHTGFTPR